MTPKFPGTLFVVLWQKSTQMGQRQDSPGADLNFKALWMGPAGIDIYGSRCHSSSKMVKFLAVLNAHCSSTVGRYYLDLVEEHGVFVQATVDSGSETGELYAAHVAFRTDNIPIVSSWHLFTNYVGLDIKQILLLGKSHNYFNSAYQLDLFNWLWPKIIQFTLDNFLDYWNNHKIRTQRNKLLPSGFSPNYICDFPETFGLTRFGVAALQPLIDALLQNIPKTLKECYRWVPDEFDAKASEVYAQIDEPKFVLTNGWTIFCQILPHFN
ncbi:hypothetical protein B0H14DRAFT_3143196 [Mycena olivaceomarginata]|nr:hypothetical protein B0H14DRAFT_3143196 [Mycena olivaceomarginata]